MDTLTHTAIGACLGEVIAGKELGKKAMLAGAIANNLPDIDVLSTTWASETQALLLHRGITHSFLFIMLFTPLLAWGLKWMYRKNEIGFGKLLLISGSGLLLHIFLDSLTAYGTGWLEPFSTQRFTLNTIFILDPVFMLPVLIASIVLVVKKKNVAGRLKWARGGLYVSGIYLLLICVNKIFVNNAVENKLKAQQIQYSDFTASPTPLNNFLWYVIARSANEFHVGYYSIFDGEQPIELEPVPRNDSLLDYPCDPNKVNDLKRFSQNYYAAELQNDTVVFNDLRFGQIGGWYQPNTAFVFHFKLAPKCSNKAALQQGRIDSFDPRALKALFKRMFGVKVNG
jgi:inner membrane protein